jgi:catechol 2,3-dioxygenase-like lactoylglutathione lyase family enzyme
MAKSIGIQHVQISVAPDQVESSRAFYIGLLGMVEIHDPFPKQGYWLAAGKQEVHIRAEADIDRRRTRAHTAFVVDDLAGCKHDLEAAGFEIFPQPKIVGYERFHVLDPSGNRIEVMQRE